MNITRFRSVLVTLIIKMVSFFRYSGFSVVVSAVSFEKGGFWTGMMPMRS